MLAHCPTSGAEPIQDAIAAWQGHGAVAVDVDLVPTGALAKIGKEVVDCLVEREKVAEFLLIHYRSPG